MMNDENTTFNLKWVLFCVKENVFIDSKISQRRARIFFKFATTAGVSDDTVA